MRSVSVPATFNASLPGSVAAGRRARPPYSGLLFPTVEWSWDGAKISHICGSDDVFSTGPIYFAVGGRPDIREIVTQVMCRACGTEEFLLEAPFGDYRDPSVAAELNRARPPTPS
jgi:hypothetical protein